jgi:carbamoyltransferase
VDRNRHGRFYEVISRFKEKTGCSVIINTSFNIRGEPIVCSPADAFRCFMNCEMDVLVLENFILRKEEQDKLDKKDIEGYKKQFKLD